MLHKNLMEDKPLNLNQPFLSVRRHVPTATSVRTVKRQISKSHTSVPQLPSHRSELKSGPIRNPGAVPFLWEHSPGQPKEDPNPQNRNSDKPPVAPKLPPGRHPKADQVDDSPRANVNERRDIDATNNISRTDQSLDENAERSKACSESGDSDEAYVDALDTLSRAESSFLNCSMSGLSDLGAKKPSVNLSTDREFMMDRFLPAAKAMATETTPQYAPKKQSFLQRETEKTVNRHKPSLRYGPSFADRYSYYEEHKEEKESDDSDDEYNQRQNVPAMCGLLPRFCLKSSLGLLNPVPAMSVRTRVASSSAKKVDRRSSSAGSYNEIENESRSDQAELKSLDKIHAAELDRDLTKLRNNRGHAASLSTSTNASAPFLEDKEVISVAEEKTCFKMFQELLDGRGSPEELGSGDPIVEKTLYVDTEQNMKSTDFSSSPKKRDEDHELIIKRIDQTRTEDSSLEDLKKLLPNNHDFKVIEQVPTESFEKHFSKSATVEKSLHQNLSGLLSPPPLPKSPSDSWLWRTLPSVSTKSSSLRSYLDETKTNHEKQLNKTPTATGDKKWETIVKATNVKHHHLHYSEEMLTTIPET